MLLQESHKTFPDILCDFKVILLFLRQTNYFTIHILFLGCLRDRSYLILIRNYIAGSYFSLIHEFVILFNLAKQ